MGANNHPFFKNVIFPKNLNELFGQKGLDASRQFYRNSNRPNIVNDDQIEKKTLELSQKIHQLRTCLTEDIAEYYVNELVQINTAYFNLLSKKNQQALKEKLQFIYFIIAIQYELDEAESRRYTFNQHLTNMNHCLVLIKRLEILLDPSIDTGLDIALQTTLSDSQVYLKFYGWRIVAPSIVQSIKTVMNSQTVLSKKILTDINDLRLNWCWGSGMMLSILDMLADDFFYKNQAVDAINFPGPVTGYMSWILYYTRFGIELMLLLKHTIKGWWMSDEEANIPRWARVKAQWNQRKFVLLNDLLWATVNMVCFFWLKGMGFLGFVGNALTVVFYTVDIISATLQFFEQVTEHDKTISELNSAQKALAMMLEQAQDELQRYKDLPKDQYNTYKVYFDEQIILLEQEIASLKCKMEDNEKLGQKIELDWTFKKYKTINELSYCMGMLIGFSLACCFFCPPIVIAGGVLCFLLNTAYAAIPNGLDSMKSKQLCLYAQQNCAKLLEKFNEINNSEVDEVINEQRFLYLEMKRLTEESEHQQALVHFQNIKLVHSVIIDAVMPSIIFSMLIFLPFGIGLGVLAAGFVLTIVSNIIINQFQPDSANLPEFNTDTDTEFTQFQALPCLEHFKKKDKRDTQRIFSINRQLADDEIESDKQVFNFCSD